MKYLLPCDCGHRLTIDKSQAGQSITCPCGATLKVPAMRGLGEFEVVEEPAQRGAYWSPLQGGLFVGGMLVIAACLGFGGYELYQRSLLDTRKPEQAINQYLERIEEEYGKLTSVQLLAEMHYIEEKGLGERRTLPYVENQRRAARMLVFAYVAFGVAAAGLGACVSAVFWPKPAAES